MTGDLAKQLDIGKDRERGADRCYLLMRPNEIVDRRSEPVELPPVQLLVSALASVP